MSESFEPIKVTRDLRARKKNPWRGQKTKRNKKN
jgi:ribosomal protein S13